MFVGAIMNIISMSVFGNNNRYIVGAKRQIELAKKYYDNWTIRLYVDNIDNFKDLEKDIQLVEVKNNLYGVFWRFEPLFESENNITIIRDSDDRISLREYLAVQEWLVSDKLFHNIKDHDAHYEYPIMAGLFGYKGKFNSSTYEIMKLHALQNKFYLSDQFFLRDFIFPQVIDSVMLHSLNEGWFSETRKRLINPYCFCGNGYDEQDIPIYPASINSKIDYSKDLVFDGGRLTDLS
jgi:protein O-GlcNAc transferase